MTKQAISAERSLFAALAGRERDEGMELAIVGSFTTPDRRGNGRGIEVFRRNSRDEWHGVCGLPMPNPSYLLLDERSSSIFVAHGALGMVSALRLDREIGALGRINEQQLGGTNPVHLAISPDGGHLLVVAYTSGNLIALPIMENGALGPASASLELPGAPGPNTSEQRGSHPHQIVVDPTGRWLIVPDKGLDKVFTIAFDPATPSFSIVSEYIAKPGSGPRHAAFHPNGSTVYVDNEMGGTVSQFVFDGHSGSLTLVGSQATLPEDYSGPNATSEMQLSPCARSLFVANRGHDSIVRFGVDAVTGALSVAESWVATGGAWPRCMTLGPKGDELYVANQDGNNIMSFALSASETLVERRLVVETGSPSSIVFAGP